MNTSSDLAFPSPLLAALAVMATALAPALAWAQSAPASASPGATSFTWFFVLAAVVVLGVLLFLLSGRRRKRIPVEPR